MCRHYGEPGPCPTCECGMCGRTPPLYKGTDSRTGAVKGRHARFLTGHQTKLPDEDMPDGNEVMVAKLLQQAIASGVTGDDLVKVFLDSNELAAAIVLAQVQKALAGNIQAANWLFSRGIGTARAKVASGGKGAIKFSNPLDATDELYE